jgi:hypothetical protein
MSDLPLRGSYSIFYDVSKLDEIAINLFYGWGYNFYRLENQLRADDQLIRRHVGHLLGASRSMLEAQQADYRQKNIKPPTRGKPFPEQAILDNVETLAALSHATGQIEGAVRGMPVPENDRMTQRYRQEAETLGRLCELDQHLVGQAETLRQMIEGKDADALLEHAADLRQGFAAMTQTIRDRQALLL